MACLQHSMSLSARLGAMYTDNSVEFIRGTQDRSMPHGSETQWIAERVIRTVKEGTAATLVQSGFSEEWTVQKSRNESHHKMS